MNKSFLVFFCFTLLIYSCKETPTPLAPLPIPDPTVKLGQTEIDIQEIHSQSAGSFNFKKKGPGLIKYEATSNKNWLIIDNPNGILKLVSDTVRFHVKMPSEELIEGENAAIITVKNSINGKESSDIIFNVKGTFKPTILQSNTTLIELGTIKSFSKSKIILSKTGLEDLEYLASTDQPWLKINKTQNSKITLDSLEIDIDTEKISAGNFEGFISILPKVLGQVGKTIMVKITGNYDDTISGEIQGHTLSKDETWAGMINLNGSIVIPKSRKLTIKPGTIINIKNTLPLSTITCDGKLFSNGDINNIIEMKSSDPLGTNSDWNGLISNGEIELSYSTIKNAKNALSFEFFTTSSSSIPPKIHHVLFDKNFIGIFDYKTTANSSISNVTFRDTELFSIKFYSSKNTTLESCEFLNDVCYIDLDISSNNGIYNIKNSNFTQKKFSHQSHMEVISGFQFNTINTENCYGLNTINGIWTGGNILSNNSDLSTPNLNIGCGFINKYPANGRKKYVK
ncbi:hypothetical protein EGI22_22425 [Lacihabitans sp. LS3-19]|uniref:BACON domain-containing protein n=1 Tax=Lacihabitans sp. LS3-19 TaxID=2487335 RepID=UPI0020CC890F|nr:hypothetical protein [Lacihabitans sp. LS3-19]MCP9770672.1 hypothetical protein [Lacihabitans sp. LS3-19]